MTKISVGHSLSQPLVPPDVLKGDEVVVNKGLVDFREHIHALGDLSKHGVNAIQIIQILTCGDQKLGAKRKQTHTLIPQTSPCVRDGQCGVNLRAVLVAAVVHH